jgi:hypothetical protein
LNGLTHELGHKGKIPLDSGKRVRLPCLFPALVLAMILVFKSIEPYVAKRSAVTTFFRNKTTANGCFEQREI